MKLGQTQITIRVRGNEMIELIGDDGDKFELKIEKIDDEFGDWVSLCLNGKRMMSIFTGFGSEMNIHFNTKEKCTKDGDVYLRILIPHRDYIIVKTDVIDGSDEGEEK